jgi:hypothetical protein
LSPIANRRLKSIVGLSLPIQRLGLGHSVEHINASVETHDGLESACLTSSEQIVLALCVGAIQHKAVEAVFEHWR